MTEQPEKFSERIGFLGTGRMGTALGKGLVQSGALPSGQLLGYDLSTEATAAFRDATGGQTVDSIADLLKADIIVLALKPQHMREGIQPFARQLEDRHLLVSIAAGLPISFFTDNLGPEIRIVRAMPNTPCLVGAGATAFALGGFATDQDGQTVKRLLSTVGLSLPISESLLDAVTGLSGSGPAYVYQMIEALSDGGVRAGLPRDTATQLAAQTLIGAARMVLETGEHPGALKDAVTSPGGTTIAGVHELERGGLRATLMNAVLAATERARQLSGS